MTDAHDERIRSSGLKRFERIKEPDDWLNGRWQWRPDR
jgi:hypothetical protein